MIGDETGNWRVLTAWSHGCRYWSGPFCNHATTYMHVHAVESPTINCIQMYNLPACPTGWQWPMPWWRTLYTQLCNWAVLKLPWQHNGATSQLHTGAGLNLLTCATRVALNYLVAQQGRLKATCARNHSNHCNHSNHPGSLWLYRSVSYSHRQFRWITAIFCFLKWIGLCRMESANSN